MRRLIFILTALSIAGVGISVPTSQTHASSHLGMAATTSTKLGTLGMKIDAYSTLSDQIVIRGEGLAVVAPGNSATGAVALHRMSNGKIAFVGINDYGPSLDVINPDGSGFRRLTPTCTMVACIIRGITWSPDGRRIAFLRGRPPVHTPGNMSLFVINANGSGERRLARCEGDCSAAYGSRLSWSPDGSRIVFSRFRFARYASGLYIANATGAGLRRLTRCISSPCTDVSPAWSPDGSRIVFSRNGAALYMVNPDGSGLKRLTNLRGYGDHPVWSPDGRRIAFEGMDRIYTVSADGTHLRLLVSGPRASGPGVPSWSPDGTQLLFFSTPGHSGAYKAEVWVMNANGTQRRRLYHSICCVGDWGGPIWSPDGKRIAFAVVVDNGPQSGTFLMNADGLHLHRLLHISYAFTDVAWQPIP